MRTPAVLETILNRIENARGLDKPAAALAGLVRRGIRPGPVEDALSGTAIGHPLHPALVAVPIGAWASAGLLDAVGERDAARMLTGFGVLTALPAAASGASDWLSTEGAEKRVGFVHAVANDVALGAYGLSWIQRRRGGRGLLPAAVGGLALGFSGWLGGHLAYAQGVGVDTTAYTRFPADWTVAGPVPDGDGPHLLALAGVPILAVRVDGAWTAMADRCTHRGGPLHEGPVENDCIVCPWHGSAFGLRDGSVRSGPATRPQPLLDVREVGGHLEVRRVEPRTLRTNPV